MDFANRANRSAQQPQSSQPVNNSNPTGGFEPPKAPKGGRGPSMDVSKIGGMLMLGLGAVLITAVIFGLVFGGNASKEADLINDDLYQAVFLDSADGQVYFGRLDVYSKDLYRLTDIFYVRVEQPLQPEGVNQASQPNISLAKLGNELHGPQDAMYISKANVLYWENLKSDGQVATAIAEFDANGRQTQDNTGAGQQNPVAAPQGNATETQPAGTPEQDDTPAEGTEAPAQP